MSAKTECELKIPGVDLSQLRTSLTKQSARRLSENEREVNILFDYDDRRLASAESVLRLRRTSKRWILTFKSAPQFDGGIKMREELETDVSDGELLALILERLGVRPSRRYDKDRELWLLQDVEIALDHTPMGDFVELEGSVDALEDVVRSLGLESDTAVRASYPTLWEEFRQQNPNRDLPRDMVFDT